MIMYQQALSPRECAEPKSSGTGLDDVQPVARR
jgi:hypothetical protein